MILFLLQRVGGGNETVYLAKYKYDYTFTSKLEHARKFYKQRDAEYVMSRWRGAVQLELKRFILIEE